jgi:autotransporter-associated beta strand protein
MGKQITHLNFKTQTLLFAFAISAFLPSASRADVYSAAVTSTVQAKIGTDASNTYLDVEGPTSLFINSSGVSSPNGSAYYSFGAMDFSAASFGLTSTVISVSSLSLQLTESNVKSTVGGAYNVYLMNDTTTALTDLHYDTGSEPAGVGTISSSLTLLGSGNFAGTPTSNLVDTTTFSLSDPTLINYVVAQLNSSANLRLVVATTNSSGYYTWLGTNGGTTTKPILSLNLTLDIPSYSWSGGSGTWDAATTNWRDATNASAAWDSSKRAVFNTGSGTVDLGADQTTTGLKFDVGGYTITSSNLHTLTLSANASGNLISVTNSSDTATISAPIAGSTGLSKLGAGTLNLSGANSFSGDVTVSGGTLVIANDTALGSSTNGITLNSGTFKTTASMSIGASRTLSGSGNIDAASGTTLNFTGPVSAGALGIVGAGTVTMSNASIALASAAVSAGATLNLTGSVTSSTSARTTFSGDGTVILAGDNSTNGPGFQLTKGSGTYGPTVSINSATSFGSTQLFLNGGTIKNATTALTGANSIGTAVSFGGNATLTGADMEFSGAWSFFNSTAKTLTVLNTTTLDAVIPAGASGVNDKLTKDGTGTLILASPNSYVGGTAVVAGKIKVLAGANLSTGNVSVAPSASANSTLELDDNLGIASTANLVLSSLGSFYGIVDLEFTGSPLQVNTLQVNGAYLPVGTYTSSSVQTLNFFIGPGSLQVLAVPEPATAGLVLAVLGGALLRRRKFCA